MIDTSRMTRKQAAAVEDLLARHALRWSDLPEPKPLEVPDEPWNATVKGWAIAYGADLVMKARRSRHVFWTGWDRKNEAFGGSREQRPIYATKVEALVASRLYRQRKMAEELARIDAAIADALANPESPPEEAP